VLASADNKRKLTGEIMSQFEYTTFVLGKCSSIAAKYAKVNQDLENANAAPFWRKNRSYIAMLKSVKAKMESEYNASELKFASDVDQLQYHVKRLAQRSAIELLSTGKVTAETMEDMTCLGNDYFIDCVKQSTIIASQLNHEVQNAEQSVKQEDVVPLSMME
jgi:hypothetical protein